MLLCNPSTGQWWQVELRGKPDKPVTESGFMRDSILKKKKSES